MSGTNIIETPRLTLRELAADQVAWLLNLLTRGETSAEFAPGYPLAGTGFAARHFLERAPEELLFGYGIYFLVRHCDDVVVGEMGFHRPPRDGVVEIGYGLAESARGQGYATEAATGLTRWALAQPGVTRVVARTEEDNLRSQGVLVRSGFRHERTEGGLLHWVLQPATP